MTKKEKVTYHEVPEDAAPRTLTSSSLSALDFSGWRSITSRGNLSVTAYFSDGVFGVTTKKSGAF